MMGEETKSTKCGVSGRVCTVLSLVLFTAYAFLLFFKVTEIPLPFNVDEAGAAYDAFCLANYHTDRFLYRFPVYFVNFGGGQNALYTYLLAVLMKLFGYSILIVRLPAILLSLASTLVLFLLTRREHGNTASLILLALFCILPFSIMHSRWGLESYLLFPMMIFSLAMVYLAIKKGTVVWWVLSGCVFGLTLYAYTVAYLLLPLFLGLLLLYLLSIRKIDLKKMSALMCPVMLAAIPLLLMLAVNYGFIDEIRTRFFSIPRFPYYRAGDISLKQIFVNLGFSEQNIFYNLFVNDHCAYNIIPKFGSLYYISIPLLIYGFFVTLKKNLRTIRNRAVSFDLLMTLLFFTAFFVSLLYESINANRACVIYLPLIYYTAAGIFEILKKSKAAGLALGAVYLVLSGLFFRYYFTEFPETIKNDSMFASISDIEEALAFAERVSTEEGKIYLLDSVQPYIFVLLARQTDPYAFNESMEKAYDDFVKAYDRYRFRTDGAQPDFVYILHSQGTLPKDVRNFPFDSEEFGTVTVYYPQR